MPTKVSPNFVALTDEDVAGITSDKPTKVLTRGKLVLTELVRTVRLANGKRVYKCPDCNYASKNAGSITPHLKVHKNRKNGVVAQKPVGRPIKKATARKSVIAPLPDTTSVPAPTTGSQVVSSLEQFITERNQTESQLRQTIAERDARIEELTAALTQVARVSDTARNGSVI